MCSLRLASTLATVPDQLDTEAHTSPFSPCTVVLHTGMNALRQLAQRNLLNSSPASFIRHTVPGMPAPFRYLRPRAPMFSPQRYISSTLARPEKAASSSSGPKSPEAHDKVTFKTEEPRLSLTFTCTVTACGTRSSHMFTRRSYERGIVIVQCPGCKNRCVAIRSLDARRLAEKGIGIS